MYSVDQHDKVVELKGVPQSSVGAPLPVVLSNESTLLLAYYMQNTPPNWNGETVQIVDLESQGEPCALVHFRRYYALMFGPPNDEAFDGHPLSERGLSPYGAFKIENSSWIRQLEQMNAVHPYHDPKRFETMQHYIFAFHDSTFECIADGFEISLHESSLSQLLVEMQRRLT